MGFEPATWAMIANIATATAATAGTGAAIYTATEAGKDKGGIPSLPSMEEEEKPETPPMLEDARAAAERASVASKKKYGMASTILTSPAGQALGGGDIKKSLAGGLLT